MNISKKPRSDSYEAQLSSEERERLHVWLLQPSLSLAQVAELTPAWHGGAWAGEKPDDWTLSKIRTRLHREEFLAELEANAVASEALLREIFQRYGIEGDVQERLLDHTITILSVRTLTKTLDQIDPQGRTAGTRMMLQRSEQKIKQAKIELALKKLGQEENKDGVVTKETLDRLAEELKLL
jgi:hypothetical protein